MVRQQTIIEIVRSYHNQESRLFHMGALGFYSFKRIMSVAREDRSRAKMVRPNYDLMKSS